MNRKSYPSDVSDEEWAFVAPYLTLMSEDAPQREHSLREVFNGLRWMVRTGAPWRYLPSDLPPWEAVYQQSQRWIKASVFEAMVADLREILRLTTGKKQNLRQSFSIRALCSQRLNPAGGQSMTERNAKRAARHISSLTLWVTYWHCL